jgi:hypothetical protein
LAAAARCAQGAGQFARPQGRDRSHDLGDRNSKSAGVAGLARRVGRVHASAGVFWGARARANGAALGRAPQCAAGRGSRPRRPLPRRRRRRRRRRAPLSPRAVGPYERGALRGGPRARARALLPLARLRVRVCARARRRAGRCEALGARRRRSFGAAAAAAAAAGGGALLKVWAPRVRSARRGCAVGRCWIAQMRHIGRALGRRSWARAPCSPQTVRGVPPKGAAAAPAYRRRALGDGAIRVTGPVRPCNPPCRGCARPAAGTARSSPRKT